VAFSLTQRYPNFSETQCGALTMAAVLEALLATPSFSSNPPKFQTFPSKPTLLTLRNTHSHSCVANASPPQNPDPGSDPQPDPTRDRRRIVRVAWEKILRWSRSWRSKANTDILQRTNKVAIYFKF